MRPVKLNILFKKLKIFIQNVNNQNKWKATNS
jgi:hypothetical protein